MFGIGTKSAKLIASAALALSVSAVGMPAAEAGDRHHHGHGHSDFSVLVLNPGPPRPAILHFPMVRSCHPVIVREFDQFGRRARFGGTTCCDGFGNGFVVSRSRNVIELF